MDINLFGKDDRERAPYSDHDLWTFARWLRHAGCPHAEDAVRLAAEKQLNLDVVLSAYEMRWHHRQEHCVGTNSIHELDEFDTIVEQLCLENGGSI